MTMFQNAMRVGFWTLICRVSGFIRDVAIAFFLGAGAVNDAFIVAFRLPNLFRTIFGEGAFSAAFVPLFGKVYQKEGKVGAEKFAEAVQSWLFVVTVIFSSMMIYFMPEIINFTMVGYKHDSDILALTVNLSRITFPYIVFMSFMAFYGGMLNSLGRFFAFASAPVILNIVQVIAIFLAPAAEKAGYALAYGALVAGFLEMLWVYIFLRRAGFKLNFVRPKVIPLVRELMGKIAPGLLGSGIAQINVWVVSTLFASFVPSGISYLYYADRVYQLPLALIGTALGTVLLASLSKVIASGDMKTAHKMQNDAIALSMMLTLPAAVGIFGISEGIVRLLFGRGQFDEAAVWGTASALTMFSLALPAFVLSKVFSNNFFALGDTKTPVKIALVSLLVNITVSWFALPYLKHVAIALGSVVSAWISVGLQLQLLRRRKQINVYRSTMVRLAKTSVSCIFMLAVIKMIGDFNLPFYQTITAQISAGIITFFGCLFFTGGFVNKSA